MIYVYAPMSRKYFICFYNARFDIMAFVPPANGMNEDSFDAKK